MLKLPRPGPAGGDGATKGPPASTVPQSRVRFSLGRYRAVSELPSFEPRPQAGGGAAPRPRAFCPLLLRPRTASPAWQCRR